MRRLPWCSIDIICWMPFLIGACAGDVSHTPSGPAGKPGGHAEEAELDPDTTDGETGGLWERELAPARIRRLTTSEIRQSLADVFFAGNLNKIGALSEGSVRGFDNRYDELTVYLEIYASLAALAEQVTTDAFDAGTVSTSCGAVASRQCAEEFVSAYGRRLYRRPLTAAESERLLAVFDRSQQLALESEGLMAVAQAMILSPNFLFRSELGSEPDSKGVTSLTSYERAAALSYYLWRSTPDDALLDAAESGALLDPEGLRAQARRLLESRRAHLALGSFFTRWLRIDATNATREDPSFTPELAGSMQRESELFFDDVLFSPSSNFASLWNEKSSFVDAELASVYGTATSGNDGSHERVSLPAERSGVLTQPAFIVSHRPAAEFSPIFLGSLIRQSVLCQPLPDPPAQVPELPQDPDLSVRERLTLHRADPGCASCHASMDPIGFAFEQFDPIGAFRPDREREPLTGEGELTGTDVDGALTGAAELSAKLGSSDMVRSCFIANVMEYLLGRETAFKRGRTETDRATVAQLESGTFADGNMLDVIVELVTSDSFLLRDASLTATP